MGELRNGESSVHELMSAKRFRCGSQNRVPQSLYGVAMNDDIQHMIRESQDRILRASWRPYWVLPLGALVLAITAVVMCIKLAF